MVDKFMVSDRILNSWKLNALTFEERWFWLACLAMANANPLERGALPDDDRQVDCEARVGDVAKTRAMLARLLEVGLIDVGPDGVRRPHDWDDYQVQPRFGRQSDAERAKNYRERKKQQHLQFDAPVSKPAAAPSPTPTPTPIVASAHAPAPALVDLGDEPFAPPAPETLPLAEPIGSNAAKQVMATRHVAMEIYGGTAVPTLVDGWLETHSADRVIHAMYAAKSKRAPAAYIRSVLEAPPSPRAAPRAVPVATPSSTPDWVEEMTRAARAEEEAIRLREEARRAVVAV